MDDRIARHAEAMGLLDAVVDHVGADDLERPTPCGWPRRSPTGPTERATPSASGSPRTAATGTGGCGCSVVTRSGRWAACSADVLPDHSGDACARERGGPRGQRERAAPPGEPS